MWRKSSNSKPAASPSPAPGDRIEHTPERGLGMGLVGCASLEGGLGAGAGATGSVGAGLFYGPQHDLRPGTFASGGAFAGVGRNAATAPRSPAAAGVFGAFAGAGIGVFVTNAASASDLRGVAPTYSLSLGEGLKLSAQFGMTDGTVVGTVTFGPGVGVDASRYATAMAASP